MSSLLFLAGSGAAWAQTVAKDKQASAAKIAAKPRVAVLYFDYSGSDEDMGFLRKGLTQMLVTDLSQSSDLTLVERTDLEAVLQELELSKSNKLDRAASHKIGKLLGAQYLITGGYFTFDNRMRVDAKVIDVERGTTHGVGVLGNPENFLALESALAVKILNALLHAHKKRPVAPNRRSPATTAPSRVPARTVARYGKALDALDRGKTEVAMQELSAIKASAPDFKPAAEDLKTLLR